jgi:hypothetical protein
MSTDHRLPLLARALVTVAAIGLAVTACSGDDDDTSSTTSETTASSTTSSTEPAGTEPADVEPYITELLAGYDEVTNQIVADPSVARDRNNPLIEDYLALVETGSEADEGAIQTWVDNAEEGITIGPYSDDAPPAVTRLDGPIEAVSEDEVRFPTCKEHNYRKYDAQGRETEIITGQFIPGQGTAVRVDGEWRLRRLDIATNLVGCRSGTT